jgi:aminopeptidase
MPTVAFVRAPRPTLGVGRALRKRTVGISPWPMESLRVLCTIFVYDKLAKVLVEYSSRLKRNENVLIEVFDTPDEMTIRPSSERRGRWEAFLLCRLITAQVNRALALEASDRQLNLLASHELARMKKMGAYVAVRGSNNITELSDVPAEKMKLLARKMRPVQDHRVKKTKWVVLRWPTQSMAQLAGMSTEAFEDFYFDVCTLDYRTLQPGMKALKRLMEKTDRVEIKGPGPIYVSVSKEFRQ